MTIGRKQYNFWPSDAGGGYDAWDVDRLVSLSAGLPITEVPVSAIRELDSDYWFGPGQRPTVRTVAEHARLIASADMSYPILMARDGRVMDGMHRVARAWLDGAATIRAVRFPKDVEPDFRNRDPAGLPDD